VYQAKLGGYIGQNFGLIVKISEAEVQIKETVQDAAGDWVEREAKLELQESKMTALISKIKSGAMFVRVCLIALCALCLPALAQSNSIETVVANQQGANIVVKVGMKNPIQKAPVGFSINNPARIALDFHDTLNATGKTTIDVNIGDLRTVNLVEAAGRSRMVFNLNKALNYATTIEGNNLIITIDGSGGVATAVNSQGFTCKS
jgi:type IV pilus assembly protein PilQ